MNIGAINNVQFTGRLKAPRTLTKGNYDVKIIDDRLIVSRKNGKRFKKLEFVEIPLEDNKWRNLTRVNNYSNGIKSKIFKEEDNFHRMDCDLECGTYIASFIIKKNSDGKIDSVSFSDSTGKTSEITLSYINICAYDGLLQ